MREFDTLTPLPKHDPTGDSAPIPLKNAFDLTALGGDPNASRLSALVSGASVQAALARRVPSALLDAFSYVPELSADLQTWQDADTHPEYFQINATPTGAERAITVEPSGAWPFPGDRLFLRLRVSGL